MIKQVINIKHLDSKSSDEWPDDFVYIGRANRFKQIKRLRWANRFYVKSERERFKSIGQYIREKLLEPDFRNEVQDLIDKILVCWCAPLPCHGHVLYMATIVCSDDELWHEFEETWLKSVNDAKSFYYLQNFLFGEVEKCSQTTMMF